MAGERKNYSAKSNAKVAHEAKPDEATIVELVAKHGVHQTVTNSWERQALEDSQFTSPRFTQVLLDATVKTSLDSRGL